MRKLIIFISALILALSANIAGVFASDPVTVIINGTALPSNSGAAIVNGRTLLPMRAIYEALGAEVSWDGETKSIMALTDDIGVLMTIGSSTMTYGEIGGNAVTVELDTPPVISEGRTLIPARAAAEALGCKVDWDASTRTVTITGENTTENITSAPVTERQTETTTLRITTTTQETTTEAVTETFDISQTPLSYNSAMNRRESGDNLIDGTTSTKWCCVMLDDGIYTIWEASRPIKVTGYSLTTGNDTAGYPGRNPVTWTLYGCNSSDEPDENSNWEIIDSREDDHSLPGTSYAENYYTVEDDVPEYRYFMFRVTEVASGGIFQLSELTLNYEGSGRTGPSSDSSLSEGSSAGSQAANSPRTCDVCGGNGRVMCQFCHGTGVGQPISVMGMLTYQSCTYCGGSGWRVCDTCGGSGQIQ